MNPIFGWVLKFIGLAAAAGGIFIAHKVFHLKDDNIIEKVVEEEIKDDTGITVDLEEKPSDTGNNPRRLEQKIEDLFYHECDENEFIDYLNANKEVDSKYLEILNDLVETKTQEFEF